MINVIIIDDEKKAREALKTTLNVYCPDVNILDSGSSVDDAIRLINLHAPDLVFLDIEMPNGNGFTLFDKIKNPQFDTIFTTAYEEYAIKAFRVSAIDYLLKPIDFRQLQQAIHKHQARKKIELKQQRLEMLLDNLTNRSDEFNKIAIPNADGYTMVKVSDIMYCSADGSYTEIYLLNGKKIVASKLLKDIEELLPNKTFYKIHRSHIVNLNLIKNYSKIDGSQVVLQNNIRLDVSDRSRKEFLDLLLGKN